MKLFREIVSRVTSVSDNEFYETLSLTEYYIRHLSLRASDVVVCGSMWVYLLSRYREPQTYCTEPQDTSPGT